MEPDDALEPLRRVLLERGTGNYPETVAAAVEAARAALTGGADSPRLWELGVLPERDAPEARRLLGELEQEFWPELRLPTGFAARDRALARYCAQDLLDGRIAPMAAAERLGYELRSADDPDSPLLPFRDWLCVAEQQQEQQEYGGGPSAELVAELHRLAVRLLAQY
ncbi:hypothetical protein [Kitasatospora phosalacinea]|uniref:Uncharacterized protein n=1 Tax=Kitasatospora phosalacinea TaxID=2065 RepID=A0A9W6PCT4_9ACTN|nr:hypothetical protein [Kitasatospora phosalacinea]GLW53454.1 hypothetical protein Kpho01_14650 [Kitasatospora phosalacinea]